MKHLAWWLVLLFLRGVCSLAGHWPQHPDGGPSHDVCWCVRCGCAIRRLGDRWWLDEPRRRRA